MMVSSGYPSLGEMVNLFHSVPKGEKCNKAKDEGLEALEGKEECNEEDFESYELAPKRGRNKHRFKSFVYQGITYYALKELCERYNIAYHRVKWGIYRGSVKTLRVSRFLYVSEESIIYLSAKEKRMIKREGKAKRALKAFAESHEA